MYHVTVLVFFYSIPSVLQPEKAELHMYCLSQCFITHLLCVSCVVYLMLLSYLMLTTPVSQLPVTQPSLDSASFLWNINHVIKEHEGASPWAVMLSSAFVPSLTEFHSMSKPDL